MTIDPELYIVALDRFLFVVRFSLLLDFLFIKTTFIAVITMWVFSISLHFYLYTTQVWVATLHPNVPSVCWACTDLTENVYMHTVSFACSLPIVLVQRQL